MEFGILGSDDGMPEFSGWERKLGSDQVAGILFIEIWIQAKHMKWLRYPEIICKFSLLVFANQPTIVRWGK